MRTPLAWTAICRFVPFLLLVAGCGSKTGLLDPTEMLDAGDDAQPDGGEDAGTASSCQDTLVLEVGPGIGCSTAVIEDEVGSSQCSDSAAYGPGPSALLRRRGDRSWSLTAWSGGPGVMALISDPSGPGCGPCTSGGGANSGTVTGPLADDRDELRVILAIGPTGPFDTGPPFFLSLCSPAVEEP